MPVTPLQFLSRDKSADGMRRSAQALWAVYVLDTWAAPDNDGLSWETKCDIDQQCWACVLDGYDVVSYLGDIPDTARLAAAEAVWPELPESVRAEIGERP